MSRKITSESFIKRARKIHGDRYDYSLVEYKEQRKRIIIVCPEHGPFTQTYRCHIYRRSGCFYCSNIGRPRKTLDEFATQARLIHGSEYEYVSYTRKDEPAVIKCSKHGIFTVKRANLHLRGQQHGICPICKKEGERTKFTQLFLDNAERVHGNYYDYSQVKYVDAHTPVVIVCPNHGPFTQYPLAHTTQESGCPPCATRRHR